MVKEGLDMYMAGESWDKARDIARNIAPRQVREMWVLSSGDDRVIVLTVHTGMSSMWSKHTWSF